MVPSDISMLAQSVHFLHNELSDSEYEFDIYYIITIFNSSMNHSGFLLPMSSNIKKDIERADD
jgi:hypothetical protein